MKTMIAVAVGTMLAATSGSVDAAEAGLFIEGADAPTQRIVVRTGATWDENTAASILCSELRTVTGVEPTKTESAARTAPTPGTLLVGAAAVKAGLFTDAEQSALGEGAYTFRVKDGLAGIIGGAGDGVIAGAYALLKEAGVIYLSKKTPGGYPKPRDPIVRISRTGKRLTLAAGTKTKSPAFVLRFDNRGHPAVGYSYRRHVHGNARKWAKAKRSAISGHTFPELLSAKEYYEEHPEYFALNEKGERIKRPSGHFCLSNPDVARIVTGNVLKWIEAQPECRYYYVGQGDGRAWCQCEKCKALDTVPGEVTTDRMLWFVNKIARAVRPKFPDKHLVFLAYTHATGPAPKRVKPEPNVLIMYCMYPSQWACDSHGFCKENAVGIKEVEDWIKWCGTGQVFIQPHPRGYKRALEIFPAFYATVERIRHYHKLGINRITYCGLPQSFGPLYDHVIGQLMWDPSLDVEQEIDEFMPRYYGKAAPYMRAYFDLMSRHIKERNFHEKCEGVNAGLVNEAYAAEAYPLFAKAEHAVAGDEELLRRIGNEKVQLLYSDLDARNKVLGNVKEPAVYAERLSEFVRLARDRRLDDKAKSSRDRLPGWFWHTARLKFNAKRWYSDPAVRAFLKDPATALREDACVQEETDGGWRMPSSGFSGGEVPGKKRNGQPVVVLRRALFPTSSTHAYLELAQAPAGPCALEVEGLDDDKEGTARIEIVVNGRSIFNAVNSFSEKDYERRSFRVPRGVLKAGKNRIEFRNVTPEEPCMAGELRHYDFVDGRRASSRYWGWFILSDVVLRTTAERKTSAAPRQYPGYTRKILTVDIPGLKKEVLYYAADGAGKKPLLVFLHASGEGNKPIGNRGNEFARGFSKQGLACDVVQPFVQRGWPPRSVDALIDHMVANYAIDTYRIYVAGSSMGGVGAWRYGFEGKRPIAAFIPIASGASAKGKVHDRWDLAGMKDKPIWMFHGTEDTTVPYANAKETAALMAKINPKIFAG